MATTVTTTARAHVPFSALLDGHCDDAHSRLPSSPVDMADPSNTWSAEAGDDYFFFDDLDHTEHDLPAAPDKPHPSTMPATCPPQSPVQRILTRQLGRCDEKGSPLHTVDSCQWRVTCNDDHPASPPPSSSSQQPGRGSDPRCPCCHQLVTLQAKTASPRVVARSFQGTSDVWAVALSGFRVRNGHHLLGRGIQRVEFEVILSTEDSTTHAWRTFEDFERLANQMGMQRMSVSPSSSLGKANRYWEQVRYHHRRFFDQFELSHLIQQFHRIDAFIELTVFALDSPGVLVDFVNTDQWEAGRWFKSPPVCGQCEL